MVKKEVKFMKLVFEENSEMKLKIKESKDLSYFEKEICVVVYGYPYSLKNEKWLKADDIYTLYNLEKEEFIKNIDGSYAILIFNKNEKKLKTFIDPYKIYTFYMN